MKVPSGWYPRITIWERYFEGMGEGWQQRTNLGVVPVRAYDMRCPEGCCGVIEAECDVRGYTFRHELPAPVDTREVVEGLGDILKTAGFAGILRVVR